MLLSWHSEEEKIILKFKINGQNKMVSFLKIQKQDGFIF